MRNRSERRITNIWGVDILDSKESNDPKSVLYKNSVEDNVVDRYEDENTTSTIITSRPKWVKVYEGYPKNDAGTDNKSADLVFKSILGDNYDRGIFSNACATRVSLGLLNGCMTVKKDFIIQQGEFKGKGFVASAANLKKWLSEIWSKGDEKGADEKIEGPSDIIDVKNIIGERNGVYVILGGFGGGVSGHATLWIGANKDVVGGHNYVSYGGTIYFWELK